MPGVQLCVADGVPLVVRRPQMWLRLITIPLYRMPLVGVPVSSLVVVVHPNRIGRHLNAVGSVHTVDPVQRA